MREKRRVGPQLLIYRKKRESSSGVSLPKFPTVGGGLLRPAFFDGPTDNLEKWGKKFHYYRLGKETPDSGKEERKGDKREKENEGWTSAGTEGAEESHVSRSEAGRQVWRL